MESAQPIPFLLHTDAQCGHDIRLLTCLFTYLCIFMYIYPFFVVVQLLSRVCPFVIRWATTHQSFLSFTISQFAQTHVHRVSDAIQPPHPLLSPSPPALNLSQHQGLCNEFSLCVIKYWSFSISPSNDYSGLISFTIDWFDLLAVQGVLKSLLQHHSSKASVLQCSAFFMV